MYSGSEDLWISLLKATVFWPWYMWQSQIGIWSGIWYTEWKTNKQTNTSNTQLEVSCDGEWSFPNYALKDGVILAHKRLHCITFFFSECFSLWSNKIHFVQFNISVFPNHRSIMLPRQIYPPTYSSIHACHGYQALTSLFVVVYNIQAIWNKYQVTFS